MNNLVFESIEITDELKIKTWEVESGQSLFGNVGWEFIRRR